MSGQFEEQSRNYQSLDEAGSTLQGKVPSWVASRVVTEFWKNQEINWWYLTEERTTMRDLYIWIATRDSSDTAHVLLPVSKCWFMATRHYISFEYDASIHIPAMVFWPQGAYLLEASWFLSIPGSDDTEAVHIIHYTVEA